MANERWEVNSNEYIAICFLEEACSNIPDFLEKMSDSIDSFYDVIYSKMCKVIDGNTRCGVRATIQDPRKIISKWLSLKKLDPHKRVECLVIR